MIHVVALNFTAKTDRVIPANDAPEACAGGDFCWLDMSADDLDACRRTMKALNISERVIEEVLGDDFEGRYDVHDECLHFAVTEGRLEEGRLITSHVDVILAERFMITFHRKDSEFVRQMRKTYREDFQKFAKSQGFLLYEIGDHLAGRYRRALQSFADAVEQTQLQLFRKVDDSIFHHVAELTSDILMLRKIVLASRELFHELASRKSPFIPVVTQPFLKNLAVALDRIERDLTTEREVLNETLALYMGMVGHNTNKIVKLLTIISVIFLPLSFLCGVYGTNFQSVPEFGWKYGYAGFWVVCLIIASSLIIYMRRRNWL